MSSENDKWEIYQDTTGYWIWKRIGSNGRIVDLSTERYKNRLECMENARSNGYTG